MFVIMYFLKFLFFLVFVLLSVAFITLLERKVLGYSHLRMGPNKVFYFGLFQPFSDAMKLFSKNDFKFKNLVFSYYITFCFICIFFNLIFWGMFSLWGILFFSSYSLAYFICLIGLGVYFLLFMGWSSNSKFSLLGGFRSSAQSISYEAIMVFLFLFFIYYLFSLNAMNFYMFNYGYSFFYFIFISFMMWVFSCFAECNRSPFDFSEGESELVSGFNTEYSGGLFSLIFIGEYSFIIGFSYLSSIVFMNFVFLFPFLFIMCFMYLWVRASFPRLRYDFLMYMAWSSLLFMVLFIYFLFIFLFL